MILEATLMQRNTEVDIEETEIQEEENKNDMETNSFLHDNLGFDVISKAEQVYRTCPETEGKDVWSTPEIFGKKKY